MSDGDLTGLGEPRALGRDDAPRAARAIARAFSWHEPWGAWVLPDESSRESILEQLVLDDLHERFLGHGHCSTIGGVAATLWIPPPSAPGAELFAARRSEEEYRAYGAQADALREGDDLLGSLQPEGEFWYLDTIATDPGYMRRGLGARLLDRDLALWDERGQRCALDTHTPENVGFYERRGFGVVAEGKLPGEGPDVYVMVREPS